jgi:hypothetical protein
MAKNRNKTRKNLLPKLRKTSKKGKRFIYKLNKTPRSRHMALNEGIKMEMKKRKYTQKKAAQAKKARLNVQRIYRRYSDVKACRKITSDMKYLDKKYNLGTTSDICGK